MTTTSTPPPPSGGLGRLVLVALLLFGGGAGLLWFALSGGDEKKKSTVADMIPDAGPTKTRNPSLGSSELVMPDDLPDAGPEEPEEPDAGPPAKRARRGGGGGGWACSGEVDRAAASAVIARNRAQVRSCYERALKQNNYLSGTLNVELRVGSGGRVEATRFSGSLRDPAVRSCVSRLTRGWRFPSVDGRCAILSVPFNLSPRP